MSLLSEKISCRFCLTTLMVLTLFFIMGCKMDNSLVKAVLEQGSLDKFKSRDVSKLVITYIPIGTERQKAIDLLKQHGFYIIEKKMNIPGCPNCDSLATYGGYDEKRLLPFLPYKSFISILLGYKDDVVVYVSGTHSPNPF